MSDLSNLAPDLDGSTARTISSKLQLAENKEGTQEANAAPEAMGPTLLCLCLATIDHLSVTVRHPLRGPSAEQRHTAASTNIPDSSVVWTGSCQTS